MCALRNLRSFLFLVGITGLLLTGCRKDAKFTDEGGIQLEFSRDTVMFDTIFTTIGSVTKRFVARNPNNNAVRVDIALEGSGPSPFRINVDGASGTSFSGVEILGGDSIFIFVEATLDQNNQSNPFVIEDHILFNTNGSQQQVLLVAWGRDAIFHYPGPDSIQVNGLPRFGYVAGGFDPGWIQVCETVVWTAEKPHVVYGYAVVDSCSTLIIEPGANIHFHNGGGLWVYRYGQIKANGDQNNFIVFQGDRLEPFYAETPGQWDRIWLNEGPAGYTNEFSNVLIKNALVGLQCENVPWRPEEPTSEEKLVLNNVKIRNCSAAGILSRNYSIDASNVFVGDCGQYGVALTGGGNYTLEHFTVANYWDYEIRQTPAFLINNVYPDINGNTQVREVRGRFQNGIVYGANENEFEFQFNDLLLPLEGDLTFRNTLVRTTQSTSGSVYFDASTFYRNQSPGFVDASARDFHLTESAFARARGNPSIIFGNSAWDLDGVDRGGDGGYDLGCYEYAP